MRDGGKIREARKEKEKNLLCRRRKPRKRGKKKYEGREDASIS